MTRTVLSKITCVADSRLSATIEEALSDMAIPEAFLQRGKQVSLLEHSGLFGIGSRMDLSESRSELYRFYVPAVAEAVAARRIAEAADLYLPGRGTLFAETVELMHPLESAYDMERLGFSTLDASRGKSLEKHTVLCCIVQRGMGEDIAHTILEMGLCVPVISYGEGMGLRNKLGLLRITIPLDKEILYFVVPERDANLLEGVAVHKARLDRPGQGFIYRFDVRAYAVNLRVRSGKRSHAASMEQVISALDELRGSSEWRRFTAAQPRKMRDTQKTPETALACLSIVAEEGSVGKFVKVAMDVGAGGATVVPMARRQYGVSDEGTADVSNARESCDLIISRGLVEPIVLALESKGLFSEEAHGMAELSSVGNAVTYSG